MINIITAILVIMQFGLLFGLNLSKYISHCSVIFMSIAIVTNSLYQLKGKAFALYSIMATSLVVYLLQLNMPYQIGSKIIENLVFFSLLCTVLSAYGGLMVMAAEKLNLYVRYFLSLVAYTLIDSISMTLLFTKYFSASRLSYILSMEIFYKLLFASVFIAVLYLVKRAVTSINPAGRRIDY